MKMPVFALLAVLLPLAVDAPKKLEVPELNKKVLEFCTANLGKKIGDGECATLAARALHAAGARPWSTARDGEYVWGKRVRTVTPGKDLKGDVLPGDIVQFRDAVLVGKEGGNTVESTYPFHTSIVSAVKDDGQVVEMLHQNVGDSKSRDEDRRKVQRATLRLGDLKKGSLKIYRPQPRDEEKK